MNTQEMIEHVTTGPLRDTVIKASGVVGGSTFFSGFFLDASLLTALGQFMGGLAALVTVLYTIYRGRGE